MESRFKGFHLLVFCAVALPAQHATSTGFTDANWMSMGGVPGANGTVYATVVDGSSNLYIGGNFTIVGDVFANCVAKWNGSGWTALGSGIGGAFPVVTALAVSGGGLYAGGYFKTAGGSLATNIAKW